MKKYYWYKNKKIIWFWEKKDILKICKPLQAKNIDFLLKKINTFYHIAKSKNTKNTLCSILLLLAQFLLTIMWSHYLTQSRPYYSILPLRYRLYLCYIVIDNHVTGCSFKFYCMFCLFRVFPSHSFFSHFTTVLNSNFALPKSTSPHSS